MGLGAELKAEFRRDKFKCTNCKDQCFVQCQYSESRVWRIVLVTYRVLVALATVAVSVLLLLLQGSQANGSTIIYFTVWSYLLLTLYFIVAAVVSVGRLIIDSQTRTENPGSAPPSTQHIDKSDAEENTAETMASRDGLYQQTECDENCLPWYMVIQWILYDIALPNALLVTLVYWSALYPMLKANGYQIDSFFDVVIHGLNSVLIIIESYLNLIPVRIFHVIFPMIYGLVYMVFSIILYYTAGTVLYPYILDWRYPGFTVLCIFGILIFFIVSQLVFFIITWLKIRCARRCHTPHSHSHGVVELPQTSNLSS